MTISFLITSKLCLRWFFTLGHYFANSHSLAPNHSPGNRSAPVPLTFFFLDSIKEFVGDNSWMMIFHADLASGIGRLYLNAIDNLCLP